MIEEVLELFGTAAGGGDGEHLRDRPNAAGMTPRGVLDEELADLAIRIEKRRIEREREMRIQRARGGYQGGGGMRGKGEGTGKLFTGATQRLIHCEQDTTQKTYIAAKVGSLSKDENQAVASFLIDVVQHI